jgi:hypothetical protein
LTSAEIQSHAVDANNYGLANPHQKLFSETFDMPAINTLKLHWDFELVSGSDGSGEFTVLDAASASIDYGNFSTNHPGTGTGFPASSTEFVKTEYINTYNRTSPEASNGSAMVNALSRAETVTTRSSQTRFFVSFPRQETLHRCSQTDTTSTQRSTTHSN